MGETILINLLIKINHYSLVSHARIAPWELEMILKLYLKTQMPFPYFVCINYIQFCPRPTNCTPFWWPCQLLINFQKQLLGTVKCSAICLTGTPTKRAIWLLETPKWSAITILKKIIQNFLGRVSVNISLHIFPQYPKKRMREINKGQFPLVFQHYWKRAYDSTRLIQYNFGLDQKIL